jgi:hypothetical protein
MGVFISYANQDEDAVRALATDLRRTRQTVWLDQELRGDTWWQTIIKQIQDADVFVFALSNNSQRSKPCRAELEYARALGIPVLPVQIGPLDGLRSTPIADLQIVDYRQRHADAALGLIAAVQEATARRGPLPEPLPDQPPIPFEYLMRLGRAIDAPQMNPSEQVGVLAQLRQGLEDEDDTNARRDITMLLRNMRRRPDATYRSVSEIDALLATIDQAPPTEPETPGQPFPSHGASTDRYAPTGATTEEKAPEQGRPDAEDRARPKANKWTAPFEPLPSWFLGLRRKYQDHVRPEAEEQDTTERQTSIDPTDSFGRRRVTRRQIVLATSAAAVVILLVVVMDIVGTHSQTAAGPWTVTAMGTVYVYQSPSLASPMVGTLGDGIKVAIQCTAEAPTWLWYRIENGYILKYRVQPVTDTSTVPSC